MAGNVLQRAAVHSRVADKSARLKPVHARVSERGPCNFADAGRQLRLIHGFLKKFDAPIPPTPMHERHSGNSRSCAKTGKFCRNSGARRPSSAGARRYVPTMKQQLVVVVPPMFSVATLLAPST